MGDIANKKEMTSPPEGWYEIRARVFKGAYWLAALIGLAVIIGLSGVIGTWAEKMGTRGGLAVAGASHHPWIVTFAVLVLFIPLHEGIHLLGQPGWGLSERSIVVLWPAKLRFGVYYEGHMSRGRWLTMRLAPLILLSIGPLLLLALLQFFPQVVDLEIGLSILMIANTLGSGADLLAALVVLRQVPRKGQLLFQAGRGYWRPSGV